MSENPNEIVIKRTINAPRDMVWKAWSEPKHLIQWWGPDGFSNTFDQFEFKPGGIWKLTMHGPDGKDYPNEIVFDDIVEAERIAYTHNIPETAELDRKLDLKAFKSEVTFEAIGEKTKITLKMIFADAAECEKQKKIVGAVDGGNQTLGRLAAHAAELAGKAVFTFPSDTEIKITRVFDASREQLWKAIATKEGVQNWWGPKRFKTTIEKMDFKVGGVWRFVQEDATGVYAFNGTYKEIIPMEKTVATFEFEGMPGHILTDTTTFADEADGKTRMTVISKFANKQDRDGMLNSGMEDGSSESWDRLADLVSKK